ncbi:nucleotidyltransferase family protein [Prevotella sp. kh1p2]|uniref:nucleotidyltransferase family protein n=1 Tax=Prevotella sp. kh1p2 TaxID=1761883 RepID=UPI0008D0A71A|nr:nucleotidyltransferase family protein [Prevotella sp. kh1p2]SET11689.1 Uncharacterised nucleotidyltransferase [Prevotella sp. kh1p2]SNU11796.1 Uncharacterised nucleotidyltransferase [Prevotellaceae bacterium KH2P17]
MKTTEIKFLQIYKLGLYQPSPDSEIFRQLIEALHGTNEEEWAEIVDIALIQTVVGQVTDGMMLLPHNMQPSRNIYFSLLKKVSDVETENKRMNAFVPILMYKLIGKGCHCLLLKGQGAAVNYAMPLHRQPGDIDLFFPQDDDYQQAKLLLEQVSDRVGGEKSGRKHSDYDCAGFVVELHGDIHSSICRQCDKHLMDWAKRRIEPIQKLSITEAAISGKPSEILIASDNFNVLFIFIHLLNHFMNGGIGLRQISDWMMYMDKNYTKINTKLLEEDINMLGVRKFWCLFAVLAVEFLGFPKHHMPFYETGQEEKAMQLMENVLSTGNFGARQKKKQLPVNANPILKKLVTFAGQIPVYSRNAKLFPGESAYCFLKFMGSAVRDI